MSDTNGDGTPNHVENPVGSLSIPGKNGGKLRRGGTNRGGPGRPPSVIRARCRGSFQKRIKLLEEVADGEALEVVRDATGRETAYRKSASVTERLKAVDLLAKYGLGTTVTETDTEGRDVQIRVFREPVRRLIP